MLAIERQEQIVSQIRRNGAVRIHELTKQFSVSVETIRRDLLELEQRYEKLDIPYQVRRVIDDYIACMRTRDERFAQLCCMVRS